MGAAFLGVDAVGEGQDGLGEAVVVLHRHFHQGVVHRLFVIEGEGLHHPAVAVDVPHQVGDAAVEIVSPLDVAPPLRFVPMADEADFQPLVQVGDFLEVVDQDIEIVLDVGENLGVGAEGDNRAVVAGGLAPLQVAQGEALGVLLEVDAALAPDFGLEVLGEAVDHRAAHAVQNRR